MLSSQNQLLLNYYHKVYLQRGKTDVEYRQLPRFTGNCCFADFQNSFEVLEE